MGSIQKVGKPTPVPPVTEMARWELAGSSETITGDGDYPVDGLWRPGAPAPGAPIIGTEGSAAFNGTTWGQVDWSEGTGLWSVIPQDVSDGAVMANRTWSLWYQGTGSGPLLSVQTPFVGTRDAGQPGGATNQGDNFVISVRTTESGGEYVQRVSASIYQRSWDPFGLTFMNFQTPERYPTTPLATASTTISHSGPVSPIHVAACVLRRPSYRVAETIYGGAIFIRLIVNHRMSETFFGNSFPGLGNTERPGPAYIQIGGETVTLAPVREALSDTGWRRRVPLPATVERTLSGGRIGPVRVYGGPMGFAQAVGLWKSRA